MGAACTTNTTVIHASITSLNDDVNITKILLTGPSHSGKSHMLSYWLFGEVQKYETNDLNIEKIASKSGQIYTVWEISGKPNMRSKRRNMFYGTQGIVFVISNSNEKDYLEDIKLDVNSLLCEKDLKNVPVLVVINQTDCVEVVPSDEIMEEIRSGNTEEFINRLHFTEVRHNNTDDIANVFNLLESLLPSNKSSMN